MQFSITNNTQLSNKNSWNQYENCSYWFDYRVKTKITEDRLYFWFGASWPIYLDDIYKQPHKIKDQNGNFFFGWIKNNQVIIYSDFNSEYPIFYYHENNKFMISNMMIDFSSTYFSINNDWIKDVILKRYHHDTVISPKRKIPQFYNSHIRTDDNTTPINKVCRLGATSELSISAKDVNVTEYFNKEDYYIEMTSHKLPSNEVDIFIADKIQSNINAILAQTPGKIGVLGGTGIDSLTVIQGIINSGREFNTVTYSFNHDPLLKTWGDKAKKLHTILELKGQKTKFIPIPQESLFDHLLVERWVIPSAYDDLFFDVYCTNRLPELIECEAIIKGSYGDATMLHEQRSSMTVLATMDKTLSYDNAVNKCRGHYAYQHNINSLKSKEYDEALQNDDLALNILGNIAFKASYIADDIQLSNKPIYSPYIDREIWSSTARMAFNDIKDNMLDIRSQKSMLDPEILSVLNEFKSGEQEMRYYTFPVSQQTYDLKTWLIEWLIDNNLYPTVFTVILPYHKLKVGDTADFELMRIIQLSAWLQNFYAKKS